MAKLFPEYLNQGSKGPAVAVLQMLMKVGGYDPNNEIVVDGEYGEKTAAAVKRLQHAYSIEEDGNFGPETRAAFQKRSGFLDVNALDEELFVHQGTWMHRQYL